MRRVEGGPVGHVRQNTIQEVTPLSQKNRSDALILHPDNIPKPVSPGQSDENKEKITALLAKAKALDASLSRLFGITAHNEALILATYLDPSSMTLKDDIVTSARLKNLEDRVDQMSTLCERADKVQAAGDERIKLLNSDEKKQAIQKRCDDYKAKLKSVCEPVVDAQAEQIRSLSDDPEQKNQQRFKAIFLTMHKDKEDLLERYDKMQERRQALSEDAPTPEREAALEILDKDENKTHQEIDSSYKALTTDLDAKKEVEAENQIRTGPKKG